MPTALALTDTANSFWHTVHYAALDVRFESKSSNVYRINGTNGDWIEVRGSGFAWIGGRPYAGTVTKIVVGSGGQGEVEVSGLGINLVSVYHALDLRAPATDLIKLFGATTFVGRAGNDVWLGNEANDLFYANGGADSFVGYGGNDTAYGSAGDDSLDGGEGNDYLDGGADRDTLAGANGTDQLRGGTGDDYIAGGNGNDTLYGQEDNDLLFGGAGADYLSGGTGTDTASYAGAVNGIVVNLADPSLNTGDAAGDTYNSVENLIGTDLGDSLSGNANANRLDGGYGNDTLTGGTGADIFVFSTEINIDPNVDTITDFDAAADTIHLDDLNFTTLASGTLSAGAFKDTAGGPKDADDRIIYNSETGALYYDADGSGAVYGNIRFATLAGAPALTAVDFVVI